MNFNEFKVKPIDVRKEFHVSEEYLRRLRYEGTLIQGVHYIKIGTHKGVLYHYSLILDWLINRHDPTVHQRAIENFQQSLPSNRPRKPGPKKSA
jgi:hypothetical protein